MSDDSLFCEQRSGRRKCYPRLLLVGASKSATSSLAIHLSANPHIQMRCRARHHNDHVPAEPQWVNLSDTVQYSDCVGTNEAHVYDTEGDDTAKLVRLEEEMSVQMSHGATTSLEYTPNYLYHPATSERLHDTFHQLNPQFPARLRFVIMLREPVARTVSSYWFKGGTSVADAMLTFDRQMLDYQQHEACVARGSSAVKCGSDGRGAAWLMTDHISKSVYAPQLERFLRFFNPSQMYVTSMEQFYGSGDSARDEAYVNMLAWAGVPVGLNRSERNMVLSIRRNPTHNNLKQPLPSNYSQKLKSFFVPYNLELFRLLGSDEILRDWADSSSSLQKLQSAYM